MTSWSHRPITFSILFVLVLLMPLYAAAQTPGLCDATPTCLDQTGGNVGYKSTYATAARVRRLSYRSGGFERMLEHELDRRDFYDSSAKLRASFLMTRLKEAAETLQSRYELGATVENSTTEARNLFRVTDEVDDLIHQTPLSRSTLRSWNVMRQEISLLVIAYQEAACKNLTSENDVGPVREYQSAASSYSRIWRF